MSDLISRQMAIDAILGITAMRNTIPLDSAIFNIKKLPPAQQWILCSERLPDEGQDVLITDGTLIFVDTLVRTDCGYMWEDDYGYWHPMDEWKAWMPLPAPYEESEV